MSDPKTLQQQRDLLVLGFDPGALNGSMSNATQAALKAYATENDLDQASSFFIDTLHRDAEGRRALLPVLTKVDGKKSNRKKDRRNFAKAQYIQIHQTDYWPTSSVGMKTNLYVSKEEAFEVHPIEFCIVDNYSDFYHIETAWVSESRKKVVENGKTYRREAGVWTSAREDLLETAIIFAVQSFRERGVNPILITHRQTYKSRLIDPDIEIAQAAHRIALKQKLKLDFGWTRGSGTSATGWYLPGHGPISDDS